MRKLIKCIFVFGLMTLSAASFAQREDSVSRKNVIKYNLTSHALYRQAILFQYERVLNNHRSISIQAGQIKLPDFTSLLDDIQGTTDFQNSGYNVTVDYRFYLAKENKHYAPRGVYIAPFASIHNLKNNKEFEIKSDETGEFEPVVLDTRMNVLSAGVALGYQFVVWERMTLDFLLLGPSISNYNIQMELDGDLSQVELDENRKKIFEKLAGRWPFFDDILENQFAEFNGTSKFSSLGFRYSVSIGFRF